MTKLGQITSKIIQEQALIIGPLAWDEAKKVDGINVVDRASGEVEISSDDKSIIDMLVGRYERLFGRASHEVCRHAAAALIADLPAEQVPASLR